MKLDCPKCDTVIATEDINIQTDVALCKQCGEVFKISEDLSVVDNEILADLVSQPPKGAWFRERFDGEVIGASTRSASAFFMIPFACVWSGFSIGGIYGSQFSNSEFNWGMSLFGVPFLIGSIALGSIALMSVCGKVEVSTNRSSGVVFVGVRKLGWKRQFRWDEVERVSEAYSNVNQSGGQGQTICLEGKRRLKFASNLNEERRYFMLNVIKYLKHKHGN